MASIFSMISLIVVLLATYSYAAPVVSDLQNATLVMETENATTDIQIPNLIILAREHNSTVHQGERGQDKVGLSSSSEEDVTDEMKQTTESVSQRDFEDASISSVSETNMERDMDSEVDESSISTDVERTVTEESVSTEINTKRGIDVESFESSTVEPSTEVINAKRSSGWFNADENQVDKRSSGWLNADENQVDKRSSAWLNADENQVDKRSSAWLNADENQVDKRSSAWLNADENQVDKRSSAWLNADENQVDKRSSGWLNGDETQKRSFEEVEFSTDANERSIVEDSSVPSTSEINNEKRTNMRRNLLSPMPVETSSDFNKRAIGPIEPKNEAIVEEHDMEDSSSFTTESIDEHQRRAAVSVASVEAGESSTVVVLNIQPESTSDEQPSSSSTVDYIETTEIIPEQSSSSFDYETTVVPVEDLTSESSVPAFTTSKILAIIPGRLSKTQVAVNPVTERPVTSQTVEQIQLTQGQNQSIIEERNPNH